MPEVRYVSCPICAEPGMLATPQDDDGTSPLEGWMVRCTNLACASNLIDGPPWITRERQALQWIGTECRSFTTGRCWDYNRTPAAEYLADRWCEGCIAAHGLGEPALTVGPPPPEHRVIVAGAGQQARRGDHLTHDQEARAAGFTTRVTVRDRNGRIVGTTSSPVHPDSIDFLTGLEAIAAQLAANSEALARAVAKNPPYGRTT